MADGDLEASSTPSSPSGKLTFANYCWYVEGKETGRISERDPAPAEAMARKVFKIYLNAQDADRFNQRHQLKHFFNQFVLCKNKARFVFRKQGAKKVFQRTGCIIKRADGRVCFYFRDYFAHESVTKLKNFVGLKESESGVIHFSTITVIRESGKYIVQFVLAEKQEGPCANAENILDASIRSLMNELGLTKKEQRQLKRTSETFESPTLHRIPALDVNIPLIRKLLAQVTLPGVLRNKFPDLADKHLLSEVPPDDRATYVGMQQLLRLLEYRRSSRIQEEQGYT